MIRPFKTQDLLPVLQIWLETNIQAHHFINEDYWKSQYEAVKEMLPHAELYVYENASGKIDGFIGLMEHEISGLFVVSRAQSQGIGSWLMAYAKERHPFLTLHVYQKNLSAIRFYQREYFHVIAEHTDEHTGEAEYIMQWTK